MNCPVCGTPVKLTGKPTNYYYEPIENKVNQGLSIDKIKMAIYNYIHGDTYYDEDDEDKTTSAALKLAKWITEQPQTMGRFSNSFYVLELQDKLKEFMEE